VARGGLWRLVLGSLLGNYRVVHRLSEGGMGVVYVAHHEALGRRVVIKVLQPELCNDADMVQRFFNEARAATAIRSPGIVQVFDFGVTPDRRAYCVMELLEGESLAARLRRRRCDLAECCRLGRQIANVLQAAHATGITHRDLKPANKHPDARPQTMTAVGQALDDILRTADPAAAALLTPLIGVGPKPSSIVISIIVLLAVRWILYAIAAGWQAAVRPACVRCCVAVDLRILIEVVVVAVEELDRDLAAELGVACGVDRARTAAAELVLSDPGAGDRHRGRLRLAGTGALDRGTIKSSGQSLLTDCHVRMRNQYNDFHGRASSAKLVSNHGCGIMRQRGHGILAPHGLAGRSKTDPTLLREARQSRVFAWRTRDPGRAAHRRGAGRGEPAVHRGLAGYRTTVIRQREHHSGFEKAAHIRRFAEITNVRLCLIHPHACSVSPPPSPGADVFREHHGGPA
jgi:hypothetical protein